MDITYLLWLQDFRNSINDALTPFMEWISYFGVREVLLLAVFIYWCIDKRKGLFILFAWKISQTLNAIVKLTACVYRPWVRDARIIPAGDAIKSAGGYSFPSGHTMMAAPILGGVAVSFANKFLRFLCIAGILLVMFSRNYLGVHTPQDVVIGALLGFLGIYISGRLLNYMDKHPEKDNLVMFLSGLAGVLTLVYVSYKPYPMDYVDGKLLVDPVKMTVDAWGDAGGLAVLAIAWYIEKRFVKFTPTGFNVKGVILCIIGLIPLWWGVYSLRGVVSGVLGKHLGKLAAQSIMLFYIMIIWPLVLKMFARKS